LQNYRKTFYLIYCRRGSPYWEPRVVFRICVCRAGTILVHLQ
jgi:hypothetical protein